MNKYLQKFTLGANGLTNIMLILAILIFAGVLSIRIALVYTYTENLEGVEQDEIYTIQRVLAGYPIYEDPEKPPFSITQKTPLYHHLCYAIGKVLDISPENPRSIYLLNRWTSLILSLCTIILAFWIQRRLFQTDVKIALIMCALMFICFEPHMFCRPDSLYSFLFLVTIAGMWFYARSESQSHTRLFVLTSVMCAVTIFAKQSAIILPAIFGGYLLFFARDWKKTLAFAGIFGMSFIILFFLVKGTTTDIFLKNVYRGVQNGIEFTWFWEFIYDRSYKKFSLIFLIGFLIIIDWIFIEKSLQPVKQIISFSLLLTFVFANITGLKLGSTPSYFTEYTNLTLIAIPFYYQQNWKKYKRNILIRIRTAIFAAFLLMIPLQTSNKNLLAPFKVENSHWFARTEQMNDYFHNNYALKKGQWIYTNDEVLKLYMFHDALTPQDDITINLYEEGVFNYRDFHRAFKDGRTPYLIIDHSQDYIEIKDADFSNYQLIDTFQVYKIYAFQKN